MSGTTRRRVITGSIVTLVALLSSPAAVLACPVCFGDPNSSMTHGLNNGIFVLLGIVFFVQGAFAAFFWRLRRAAVELDRARGRDAQRASGTSNAVAPSETYETHSVHLYTRATDAPAEGHV